MKGNDMGGTWPSYLPVLQDFVNTNEYDIRAKAAEKYGHENNMEYLTERDCIPNILTTDQDRAVGSLQQ